MKLFITIFFISASLLLFGQTTFSPEEEQDEPFRKHWSVSGNFGIYKASSANAGFYNGKPGNINNVDYVFSNYYWNQEIKNIMIENANRDSFNIESYPEMTYNSAMMAGVSLRYNFSEYFAMNIHFNFAKLQLANILNFEVYPAYPGMVESFVQGEIHGIESRSNIDISMMYGFNTKSPIIPFVELGFNLNNSLVKLSEMSIFGNTYNLVDIYGDSGYIPNNGATGYEIRQGGIGFGLYSAAGIKYDINKDFSLELLMNLYYSKINLEKYNTFGLHYGGLFRIAMSMDVFNQTVE